MQFLLQFRYCSYHMRFVCLLLIGLIQGVLGLEGSEAPFLTSELLFPLEHWHNHGSCIVESPRGDLLICWFHGSGERKADDVKIEGARLRRGSRQWSERFTLADTPDYPDTNCAMFIDPQGRLWLLWPTILANEWHTALMKYRISSKYHRDGPPVWETSEVLHVTPGVEFDQEVRRFVETFKLRMQSEQWPESDRKEGVRFLDYVSTRTAEKLQKRLGWMTRAHPFVLDQKRLIVPLYSDGFSFSLMAISDDWGQHWHTSKPLCGAGNIQPSIALRRDGSLYTLMRDNGPPPKRLMASESRDRGETWSPVVDVDVPNPGSGAEVITLKNGHWALICNDTENLRNQLTVMISDDEGKTWKWSRHLELEAVRKDPGGFHYPSLIQARDGSLHASYSYHPSASLYPPDVEGRVNHKSIKHAHFNEAWVRAGDPR